MRFIILIMLAALSLGTAVSAAFPVEMTVTSDHVWMVADNRDTVTITANVTYGTGELAGQPVDGANVSFAVNSPWQLKNYFPITDKKGIATVTLLPTAKSGTANITVTANALILTENGYVSYSVTQNLSQPIDHDRPSSMMTFYNGQVQVRTATPVSVLIRDRYGNPVDNRNVVETVKFDAPSQGISGFQSNGSWVKSITVPVNASGYVTVLYLVDPPGTNYITITPPSPLWMKLISITGLSQSTPFSVTSLVSPGGTPYPYTTVKTGQFTIGFTFYDQNGYPTMNQPVEISTSVLGESMSLTTNRNGMAIISYGPKDIAGLYTITATAVNNRSATTSLKVEFISGTPTDALLTASPLAMASRDVKDDITSTVIMRVTDSKGNPVGGETVKFRFKSFSTSPLSNQTMAPVLENGVDSTNSTGMDISVVSSVDGEAIATFHPGAFSTDFSAPGYNATATGSAVVEARWASVTRQLTLSYLNYPYLTVKSWVTPSLVRVNETVDINVKVTGDGWALQPKPIDVILLSDRSGSMTEDDPPDRAVSVMGASLVFSSQLDYARDRLGLVSFGGKGRTDVTSSSNTGIDGDPSDDAAYALQNYKGNGRTYADYATTDLNLTSSRTAIDNEIPRLVPGGYTPMRYVLKIAVDQMILRGRPNVVKALILLSDGDWNWYGDPLARTAFSSSWPTTPSSYSDRDTRWIKFPDITNSTQQNMAQYAKANNIRIFTIAFAQGISSGGQTALNLLATQTGGKYYYAPSADMLAGIYTDIAGSLKETAGVNTAMNLSFQNIAVNGNVTSGDQVYSYVYIDGHSTFVDSWNATLTHLPGYPATSNSTDEWNAQNRVVNFTIGTVQLGQVWQSTITLRVLKDGSISVFDPASKITMQDSTFPLKIPEAYFTALRNDTANTLLVPYQLSIDAMDLMNPGSRESADIGWNLTYNGLKTITEDLMISPYGFAQWDHIPYPLVVTNSTPISDTGSLSLSGRPYGYYTVRLEVSADDSNWDSKELTLYLSEEGVRELNPGEIPIPGIGATPTQHPKIKIS